MTLNVTRSTLRILVVVALGIGLSAADPAAAREYKVGVAEAGFPPFSFTATDERVGIFVEILREIGAARGDKFVLVHAPTKRLQKMFEEGDIDIEPGINPTWRPEQAAISLYSEPFANLVGRILVHADLGAVTLDDLNSGRPKRKDGTKMNVVDPKHRLIGCVRGYRYPVFERGFTSGKATRVDADNERQLVGMINARRIDAVAISELPARFHMREMERTKKLDVVLGEETDRTPIMFRIRSTHRSLVERLNQGIKRLRRSGRLEQIERQFVGELADMAPPTLKTKP